MNAPKVDESKPMEYLHPFQDKESRENWNMEMALRPVILDIAALVVTIYMLLTLTTEYSIFGAKSAVAIALTVLAALIVMGLLSAYRYALHPKLPKWARLTVMIPCYLMCIYAFIRFAMSV